MKLHLVLFLIILATVLGLAVARRSPRKSPTQGPAEWLDQHNWARKVVGLGPLTWDKRLAQYAQSHGNRLKSSCAMAHSNGPYGENLFWGSGTKWTAQQAVNGWISEKKGYNLKTNTCRGQCGHYTQIVWRRTKRVGCARVVCNRNAGVLFICEYDPPGNYVGERPY